MTPAFVLPTTSLVSLSILKTSSLSESLTKVNLPSEVCAMPIGLSPTNGTMVDTPVSRLNFAIPAVL